ncbi:prenyltransferase [Methanobacterium sp. ACI-7]|uniref:prenyltransferase n=1 Tax=unclassified Methanobacterium TaxID=2627676 RepID=UPI0039C060D2
MNRDHLPKIIKIAELRFVFGGFLYFCFGALFAVLLGAEFNLFKFIFGYGIFFLAHLSMQFSNEYFDIECDKHGTPTPFSGGSGVLVENPSLREFSLRFSVILMVASIISAAFFMAFYSYSPLFLLFVIFGNLLAWFYAAPPLKLSYRGLGEIATILTGLIFPGMGYLALNGTLDIPFFIFAGAIILYQTLFINAVQIPDMEVDKMGGKRTIIVKKGRIFGFKLIGISGALATIYLSLIAITNIYSSINFFIVSLISFVPLTFALLAYLNRTENKDDAMILVNRALSSLFAFGILINIYFIYLLI